MIPGNLQPFYDLVMNDASLFNPITVDNTSVNNDSAVIQSQLDQQLLNGDITQEEYDEMSLELSESKGSVNTAHGLAEDSKNNFTKTSQKANIVCQFYDGISDLFAVISDACLAAINEISRIMNEVVAALYSFAEAIGLLAVLRGIVAAFNAIQAAALAAIESLLRAISEAYVLLVAAINDALCIRSEADNMFTPALQDLIIDSV